MAANLFGVDDILGLGMDDEPLGIPKSLGKTDELFRRMGRAPVDELFAGRRSLLIPDEEWDKDVQSAVGVASNALSDKWNADRSGPQGGRVDRDVRDRIADENGLLVYPGQVVGVNKKAPEDMTFMREFSDTGARLKDRWHTAKTLGDALDHPLLYQHYPHLKDVGFDAFTDDGAGNELDLGYYNPSTNRIGINHWVPGDTDFNGSGYLGTFLHEVQHAIQDHEGWSGGANSGSLLGEYGDAAFNKYKNKDGEVLAREVERRYFDKYWADEAVDQAQSNLDLHDEYSDNLGWLHNLLGMLPPGLKPRSTVDKEWEVKRKGDVLWERLMDANEARSTLDHYPNRFTRYDDGNSEPWSSR